MGKLIDLTGKRFGRLVVVERGGTAKHGEHAKWVCKCDCGKVSLVNGKILRSGSATSCGCYRAELTAEKNRKSAKHGLSNERLYPIWRSMVNRCTNPKNARFQDYGGRGVSICDEWKNDYLSFREWALSNGYDDRLTLDRIDNNGDYCPENCRWVTYKEQNYNRRNTIFVTFNGETHNLAEWSKITNINAVVLRNRLERGWSAAEALMTRPRHKEGDG